VFFCVGERAPSPLPPTPSVHRAFFFRLAVSHAVLEFFFRGARLADNLRHGLRFLLGQPPLTIPPFRLFRSVPELSLDFFLIFFNFILILYLLNEVETICSSSTLKSVRDDAYPSSSSHYSPSGGRYSIPRIPLAISRLCSFRPPFFEKRSM